MTSLRKNFPLLMVSNVLSPLFSMVLVLAISRLRGAEFLGKYSLVMTVFILGQNCAAFGLPIVVTREVAQVRGRAGGYFVNACVLTLALLLAVLAVAVPALGWTMAEAEMSRALGVILLALLPSVVTLYGEAVLLAFERAEDFVAINLGENVVRALVGTLLVVRGAGVVAIAVAILAVRCVAAGVFLWGLRRRGVRLHAPLDRSLCRALLRHMPVVGSIPIVNAIYTRADVFLLTSFGTWAEVGLYSAAVRLVDLARTVPPAYARALYPILSRLRPGPSAEYVGTARRSIRDILLLVAPLSLLLCGLATPLVRLLYGEALAPAAASLRVLAWTLVPFALATTLAQILFSANRQVVDLRVNVIATVFSVIANLLLIPRWGHVGASVAVLSSTALYASLQYLWVRQDVVDPHALVYVGKLLAIAGASSLAMLLLTERNMVLSGMLGVVVYGVGLGLTGILTRQDIHRVRLAVGLGEAS